MKYASVLASLATVSSTSIIPSAASNLNPTFAFTYTVSWFSSCLSFERAFFPLIDCFCVVFLCCQDATTNWQTEVDNANLDAVYVYAGDVEFYCKGSPTASSGGGASPPNTPCIFGTTAFVYYTEVAQKAAATFKASGKTVYINFDGRITPKNKSFVPDFSKLSDAETEAFATTVANHVCGDSNVDGMGWYVRR